MTWVLVFLAFAAGLALGARYPAQLIAFAAWVRATIARLRGRG